MEMFLTIGNLCNYANKNHASQKYLEKAVVLINAKPEYLLLANYELGNALVWKHVMENNTHNYAGLRAAKDSILTYYSKVIDIGPLLDRDIQVYLRRGDVHFRTGDIRQAIDDFKTQLISHPYSYQTLKYLALAHKSIGDDKIAKKFLEQYYLLWNPDAISGKKRSARAWKKQINSMFATLTEVTQVELNSPITVQPGILIE